jgi:hypothetical protein
MHGNCHLASVLKLGYNIKMNLTVVRFEVVSRVYVTVKKDKWLALGNTLGRPELHRSWETV